MPEIEDRDRFREFLTYAPRAPGVARGALLDWLLRDGDFDTTGAAPTVEGPPHTLVVWGEDPTSTYRLYAVPLEEVDLPLDALHRRVFGARVYNDLEPTLFEPALRLILRASFEPEAYAAELASLRAGVEGKRGRLPPDAALRAELGRWHPYEVADAKGLDRSFTRLCAVRFMSWS